jgi:hypothetical protein
MPNPFINGCDGPAANPLTADPDPVKSFNREVE